MATDRDLRNQLQSSEEFLRHRLLKVEARYRRRNGWHVVLSVARREWWAAYCSAVRAGAPVAPKPTPYRVGA